jgi:hypothetical protein
MKFQRPSLDSGLLQFQQELLTLEIVRFQRQATFRRDFAGNRHHLDFPAALQAYTLGPQDIKNRAENESDPAHFPSLPICSTAKINRSKSCRV